MKFLTLLTITLVLVAPVLAQTPTTSEAQAQAKHELNEAARAYREGRFAEAQAHAERALLLDPQNRTAPVFVARIIHAQYKPRDATPENAAQARLAIAAYQRVLERTPNDDDAYQAVAYLYGELKEHQLLRAWILQRAVDGSMPNEKRSEAYVVLAAKDWECAFKFTELPNNKITAVTRNKSRVLYVMPKDRSEFEQAKECANRALEMVSMAIILTPENESAWSYKTNILSELTKLAEMAGEVEQQREFYRQYEEALKETTRLSKPSQSTP